MIEVRAAGVNFADLMMRQGLYPEAPPRPFVPGYEVAGLAGDRRVVAVTRFGGYAQRVAVPKSKVFDLPKDVPFEDGAAFLVNALTAWAALEGLARLREGDRVLIHAAAGGVGLMAIQLAKRKTDRIVGVVGSEPKADFVRARGVTPVLRGREEPGGRFDVILNSAGGKSIEEDMNRLAPLGRVVCIGASSVVPRRSRSLFRAIRFLLTQPRFRPIGLQHRNRGILGLNLLPLWDEDRLLRRAAEELLPGLTRDLKPHVDRTFPMERAWEAHIHLHERRNIGKVVLVNPASRS